MTEFIENKLAITLEGKMSIEEPSLLDYNDYKIKEIRKKLKSEIIKELDRISPDYTNTSFKPSWKVKEEIAEYLINKEVL